MAEPFRPYTSRVDPMIGGLPDTYISERPVAAEYLPPARGSVVGDTFGSTYADHIVIGSQILNRAGGRTVQITHCAPPAWVILNGSDRNRELNAAVGYTVQIIPAPTAEEAASDPLSEVTPINEVFASKRTQTVPTAALTAFHTQVPTTVNLDIPRVLMSADVIWHQEGGDGSWETEFEGLSTGDSRRLTADEDANSQGSAAVIPELILRWKDIQSSGIPAVAHVFFLQGPVTAADVLTKVSASAWPIFKPEGHSVVLRGLKRSVSARASGNSHYSTTDADVTFDKWITKGKGTSSDVSPTLTNEQIPACIHPAITIGNTTSPVLTAAASAAVEWIGAGGLPSMTDNTATVSLNVSGSVSPTTIPATTPTAVPTSGKFLVHSKVEAFDWGWFMVYCEVVDASVFA